MAHHDIADYIVSVRVTMRYGYGAGGRFVKVCDSLEAAATYANAYVPPDPNLRWIKFRVILNSQQCDRAVFAYVFEHDEVLETFKVEEMIECARQSLVHRGIYNL